MTNPQDELDELLNEALATYSAAQSRPGLEQRVLRHAHTPSAPRRSWWPWALAVPVLASLWMLSVNHQPSAPIPAPVAPARVAPPPPVIARVTHPAEVPKPRPRARRRDTFPRDLPLSAGERALVNLFARYPEQARELAAAVKPRPIEPIEIPQIQIAPLTGDIQQ